MESPQQRKERNSTNSLRNKERRERESPQERHKRLMNKAKGNKRRQKQKSLPVADNFKVAIDYAIKQGKKNLHRTQHPDDPTMHRAYVCIVCNCFLQATEPLKTMNRDQLRAHQQRLGVHEYARYHNVTLTEDLEKRYHVHGFPNMLLLPQSQLIGSGKQKGWITCSHCRLALRPHLRYKPNPPKYSIANGFVIDEFPRRIKRQRLSGREQYRDIDVKELPDKMQALLAPVWPYGYIFTYSGGSHKSIQGHYQFFETDQSQLGGVLNHVRDMGVPKDMYIMLCGCMTSEQKRIVQECVIMDTELYMDILQYFIEKSGHPGFSGLPTFPNLYFSKMTKSITILMLQ